MSNMQNQVTGTFDLSDWGTVSISGPDAQDFLQRMSTVDFRTTSAGQINHGAVLTGKGTLVGLGMFHTIALDTFHFILSPGQSKTVAEHLKKFHFAEKLTVSDVSQSYRLYGTWNLPWAIDALLMKATSTTIDGVSYVIWRDDIRPSLVWAQTARSQSSGLGGPLLPPELFHFFRIEAAVPQMGIEATSGEIILETNFDRAVARNKGCYPGQEVVERIFTYGSVNRKLLPLLLDTSGPAVPAELLADGRVAGTIVSAAIDPGRPNQSVALAYVQKNYWNRREGFETSLGFRAKLR